MAFIDKNDGCLTIRELQEMLRLIGIFRSDPDLTVPVNGLYDEGTRKAVVSFQRNAGMADTGVTDLDTWMAVLGEYSNIVISAEGIMPIPRRGYVIQDGERSDAVTMLQHMLNDLRLYYNSFGQLHVSGVYDAPTRFAVSEVQRKNGISDTGVVDLDSWNRIVKEYNDAASENQ